RAGSEYCQKVLDELSLAPQMEHFMSATSIFVPHLMASVAMLVSFAIYPLFGRASAVLAAAIALTSLISQLLELGFRDNLFRRLAPKAESQNVVAVTPPAGEHRQDLILIGHVDSQRTPLVFRTPTWVKVYQTFTTVAFVLSVVQVVLYIAGAITQWAWIWPVTILSALSAVALAAMCIEADRTPFTAGANDNATAAGLVLTLARHFQEQPLRHTRVWLVCSGCEEVQHYGAIDFFRRHRAEFVNPVTVVFEMLGCSGPSWLTKEGIIVPFRSDPQLARMAEALAQAHPELGAYPSEIKRGNTEMSDALRVGIPAITITGQGPKGEMPYWHQVGDTVDKLDPEVMARAYRFVWAYLAAIDGAVGERA
ncbi:MAG: M28 family peptidase, partial [Anaerolineae bacterium]|nr:M28 family peptidase [Anaerolineae bacterium]